MTRIQIVDTIIEKDNKILILRREFEPGKEKLDLPGGYVNKGETIEEAAIREAKEESGFDIELVKKLGSFDYFERKEKTDHVFIGKIIGGKLKSSIEGKTEWINPKKIKITDFAFPQIHTRVLDAYKEYKKRSDSKL